MDPIRPPGGENNQRRPATPESPERIQTPMSRGSLTEPYAGPARPMGEVVKFPGDTEQQPLPVWMQRTFLVIYVLFCIEIGMMLTVLPWTRVWTENSLMHSFPMLKSIAQQNFVRGMVTGIGLLDIWLGIWEGVHYRDQRPGQ